MGDSNQQANKRALYFITYYLPWIGIIMLIALISICYYHHYHKTCMFKEKENKKETNPYLYVEPFAHV